MKSGHRQAVAEDYFDWSFAQHVWADLDDVEKFDAEWAKYAVEFEPWLARYKKNTRAALDELKALPDVRRVAIQRGYDMQLAFDEWWDHVYSSWYNGFNVKAAFARYPGRSGKAATFDDWLQAAAKRDDCRKQRMLDECGPIPDWRSPQWKTKEQAMMKKVIADLDAQKAKK